MSAQVLELLYSVIDDVSKDGSVTANLPKSPATSLYGSDSALDSLGLINFVVATEQKVEKQLGKTIVLVDDRALTQEVSPFTNVGTLASYIEVLLNEKG